MKCSAGITASAVVVFCGSGLCVICGLFSILLVFLPVTQGAAPGLVGPVFIFSAILYLGLGGLGISTGVGILILRSWARISMLVFSGLLVIFDLGGFLMSLVIKLPAPENVSKETMEAVQFGMAGTYFLLFALGSLWLYYFNRGSVKRQFAGEIPELTSEASQGKPISILVIGWFLVIGSFFAPFSLIYMRGRNASAFLLGLSFDGWPAKIYTIGLAILCLVLGCGLLRWKPIARVAAVYYMGFGVLNSLGSALSPNFNTRMAALMSTMMEEQRQKLPPGIPLPNIPWQPMLISATLLNLVMLWLLITRKEAYLAVSQAKRMQQLRRSHE